MTISQLCSWATVEKRGQDFWTANKGQSMGDRKECGTQAALSHLPAFIEVGQLAPLLYL